jgi:signal transduction histidine kinase
MLYNEVKAEKSFLTLINAAVSHELRNPLNSIVAVVGSLMEFISDLYLVIDEVEDEEIQKQLEEIYG